MSGANTVSVVIPCYNAEQYIGEMLESVFRQTWQDLEVIVVDDGSTDNSVTLAKRLAREGFTLLEQSNHGAAHARNRGLEQAIGRWCVFLDADDLFEQRFIQAQVEAITAADADICFGCSVMTWPNGLREEKEPMPPGSSVDIALSCVLTDGWYPPHAILWRTQFIRQIGGWDASLRRNDDGELIARALLRGPRIAASKGDRAIYRHHDSSGRISKRTDHSAVDSNIRIAEWVYAVVSLRRDMPLSRRALSRQSFELAGEAYYLGYSDLGARAETVWRKLGAPYQRTGTLAHRIGVALLGFERKYALARWTAKQLQD
jgi:glycosyltransferase involved in cell wall biosynthesis